MSISLLKKMKRDLIKANTPTKEKALCMALRTIFHNTNEISEVEAFNILGWNYTSREELFGEKPTLAENNKDNFKVFEYEDSTPLIIASKGSECLAVDGASIISVKSAHVIYGEDEIYD